MTAIDFNNELGRVRAEIDDVGAERDLEAEMGLRKRGAQRPAQRLFRVGRIAAQLACAGQRLRIKRKPLHPLPLVGRVREGGRRVCGAIELKDSKSVLSLSAADAAGTPPTSPTRGEARKEEELSQ